MSQNRQDFANGRYMSLSLRNDEFIFKVDEMAIPDALRRIAEVIDDY